MPRPAIRVVMSGAGNMGGQIMAAIESADDLELIGALDGLSSGGSVEVAGRQIPLSNTLDALADWSPDVVVDFSNAEWSVQLIPAAVEAGVRPVIGTSGLSDEVIADAERRVNEAGLGGVVAANFALGAVLMMHLANIAAPLFDSVEIIEQHHDGKVDAPSGTAVATAQSMRAARDSDFSRNEAQRHNVEGHDSRGAELGGASLHSVRLPGLVAHQVIIFGGADETLTIRHDSMSRASFIPEILRAVRAAPELDHLVIGLDRLLGLRTD
ncbi:MAG: 4-hydroxy-tetrahydrodipicolinate reductase [Chloroflexi bacterium]|nr:4-hydroxy-tetrahydrodipicolinate reductase [Chloroflexota bacterium]MYD18012.1 4-hydroxy-tetrahydrodipicolinate reductase [Chloroflexota bacterium]MYJ02114.1 4-hydroxy-tetrahydrodipicolinate reductase [Chloroflexota bacterium]